MKGIGAHVGYTFLWELYLNIQMECQFLSYVLYGKVPNTKWKSNSTNSIWYQNTNQSYLIYKHYEIITNYCVFRVAGIPTTRIVDTLPITPTILPLINDHFTPTRQETRACKKILNPPNYSSRMFPMQSPRQRRSQIPQSLLDRSSFSLFISISLALSLSPSLTTFDVVSFGADDSVVACVVDANVVVAIDGIVLASVVAATITGAIVFLFFYFCWCYCCSTFV